jgi:hypothetical protein
MTKRERKEAIEALIFDLNAMPAYHKLAAQNWVGWDKWHTLTKTQQRNNIALAAQCEEVRHACLDVYLDGPKEAPETDYESDVIDRAIEADKEDGVKPAPRKAYLDSLRDQ